VGITMVAYGLWYGWHHGNQFSRRRCLRLVSAGSSLNRMLSCVFSRAHVPKFKILITFYQVVAVLPDLYGLEMPPEYGEPRRHASAPLPVCALTPSNAFIQTNGSTGSRC
jgi:hypothetical protein